LVYLAISLPYFIFSLIQTGNPLPNTFYAKASTEHLFSWQTLGETLTLHWRDNPVMLLLVIPGLSLAWRRSRLVVAWLLVLPLLSAFVVDFVWHHGRYTMPLIPYVMVVAAQGLEWLVSRIPSRFRLLGATVLVAFILVAGLRTLPAWAEMLANNSREIQEVDVALGNWLAENTPTDATIAVDDIGAIGYLSHRRIFDMNGLISPEMWPAIRDENQAHLRNEAATRILSSVQADFLAIFPLWHWELANNPQVVNPIARFRARTRTILGEQEAVIYETSWPYLQDYDSVDDPVASFEEKFDLLDFDLTLPSVDNRQVELMLLWHSRRPVKESYDIFVHILDSDDNIVAQVDSKPVSNLAPTSRWQPGDIIEDSHRIDWPHDAAAGAYQIRAGLYSRETGERLTAVSEQVFDNAVLLTSFEVGQLP
jgi:hypothetical protein